MKKFILLLSTIFMFSAFSAGNQTFVVTEEGTPLYSSLPENHFLTMPLGWDLNYGDVLLTFKAGSQMQIVKEHTFIDDSQGFFGTQVKWLEVSIPAGEYDEETGYEYTINGFVYVGPVYKE